MVKMLNVDCLEFMKTVPDKYFDLCCTDPPYGVNLEYSTYLDTEENWFSLMARFIPEAQRISKMVIMPCCRINGLKWIYQNYPPDWLIAWYKGSPGHSAFIGFNDWEPLLVYGKSHSRLSMHDYFQIQNDVKMGSFGHPCPKPVKWFKWLMHRAANDGKVFDPFLGSGTSALAAHDLKLDFVGCEIDKDYFDAAKKRFDNHAAQLSFA